MLIRVNCFVVGVNAFVSLAALISGLHIGGFNGVLEMNGFKDTFSHLYQDPGTHQNQSGPVLAGGGLANTSQYNQTGGEAGAGCSAGNGASSDSLIGVIVSILNIGAAVGSLLAGWLSDHFGRKYGLLISGVVMLVGAGFLSASHFVWMLIVGRLVAGVAVGIMYMVMPVYIAEMTPKESRGMLGSLIGPGFNVGIVVALLANIGFMEFDSGWRVAVALSAISGLVFAVGMAFLSHTPRWLVLRGRDHEALSALMKVNYLSDKETFVDTHLELQELRKVIDTERQNHHGLTDSLRELLRLKYRSLMMIVLFTFGSTFGKFIYYYSTTIFCEVGVPAFSAAVAVGMVVLVASFLLTFIIDKFGRKVLLLLFTVVIFASALIIALLVHLYDDSPTQVIQYTIVVVLCIYTFGYSCSWLTLTWVLNSEIFPTNIRGMIVAISTAIYWFSSFIVNLFIPLIVGSPYLQLHGFFYLLAALSLLAFFFVLFALPETKGVSLEHMNEIFSQSIWERFIGTFRCRRQLEADDKRVDCEEKDDKN